MLSKVKTKKYTELGILLVALDVFLTGNSLSKVRDFHSAGVDGDMLAERLTDGYRVTLSDGKFNFKYSGCADYLSFGFSSILEEKKWNASLPIRNCILPLVRELY